MGRTPVGCEGGLVGDAGDTAVQIVSVAFGVERVASPSRADDVGPITDRLSREWQKRLIDRGLCCGRVRGILTRIGQA